MTSDEIRQQFIDFFAAKQHAYVASSPVVPFDDSTLMFTNAGMNQFKPIFLGTEMPKHVRVANTQKCIRAGGKHNDLDDVGQDTYHHTFFEMLGNWSFGDYFKKEAIEWAWELLTKVWGVDASRLHATYFQGDPSEGLEPDSEARDLWAKVTSINPAHVHPGNKKDNFWEMGDTGPCGPCSEIHIDLTPDKSGAALVNKGDARVIELWNLVFIQFNRAADGKLTPLPARHIDTGMGFERLCAVLQHKKSNYDTDVFAPIFAAIRKRTGAPAYTGLLPGPSRDRKGAVSGSMPGGPRAFLITFHTYGTWLHGTERGSVDREHNIPGTPTLDPDAQREYEEFVRLKHPPFLLDAPQRAIVERTLREVASFRDWTIHALNVRTNHVHVAVSADAPPERVMNDFKSYATRRMIEFGLAQPSARVWTRHGSTRYLWDEESLAAAGRYVVEQQGDDLATPEGPLPHGRGSEKASHDQLMVDVSYRVIADHVRCLTFALTDGAIPSNEGRGYVLRRILRRAVRYGRQYMNMHEPFLCDLVPAVVDHMEGAFPELRTAHRGKNVEHVSTMIRDEETSFLKTLDRGIKLFNDAADNARIHHHGKIRGEDAFKLHDTYGFPIDLTERMAQEEGLTVDIGEYERLMEGARERARGVDVASDNEGLDLQIPQETLREGCDDTAKYADPPRCDAVIKWLGQRGLDNDVVSFSSTRTCFYAEQGGQVSDEGVVTTDKAQFRVTKVRKLAGGLVTHHGRLLHGTLTFGPCHMEVDLSLRRPTMQNHTATHILNWALREVLGEHVQQKGSLVDPEKTRFDFSHPKQLSEDELRKIERHVKSQISNSLDVLTAPEVEQKKAREINTLRAVFGEKYPDKVRVVSIGADIEAMLRDPRNPRWMQYSVEFCGGTHLKNSKEAEDFVLVHEEAVAKGVRRLVGVTAEAARQAIRRGEEFLEIADSLQKGKPFQSPLREQGVSVLYDLPMLLRELSEATIPVLTRHRLADTIAKLQESAKEEHKKSAAQSQRGAVEAVGDLLAGKAIYISGVTVVIGEVPGGNADALRTGIDFVRNKKGSSAVLLAGIDEGKVTLVAGMSKDLVDRGIKAGDLIKEICPLVGGKGGGRPDMAQGGGTDANGLPKALDHARQWLNSKLST